MSGGGCAGVFGPRDATFPRRLAEKSMYQKRYKTGRLAAVFDAIFV